MTRARHEDFLDEDIADDLTVSYREHDEGPSMSKRLWKPHPPKVRKGRKNSIRDGLHRRRIKRPPGTTSSP